MSKQEKFASDYIDVAARLVEFREKHPEGSLQPANPDKPFEVIDVAGTTYIVYGAAAYRSPDDSRPGIGYAYEQVPGRTPYTRNSELQNAETSAWGRAIVAALAADTKKGIASAEEVRNRQAEREEEQKPASPKFTELLAAVEAASSEADLKTQWDAIGPALDAKEVRQWEADKLADRIKTRKGQMEVAA